MTPEFLKQVDRLPCGLHKTMMGLIDLYRRGPVRRERLASYLGKSKEGMWMNLTILHEIGLVTRIGAGVNADPWTYVPGHDVERISKNLDEIDRRRMKGRVNVRDWSDERRRELRPV